MLNRSLKIEHLLAWSLAATSFLWFGTSARAQSAPAQDNKTVQTDDSSRTDSRTELTQFRQFLDSHPEIAEQLRKDPSLADNQQFLKTHPALQTFLQQQPGIQGELKDNPNAFMRQEDAFNRDDDRFNGDATTRRQLAAFDQFLDSHPEIAEQLRKDPSLADNRQFLETHPALQTFLQEQPGVRDELRQNPNAFMRQEDAFERDNRRDHDERVASFKGFLDGHSDISEELSRDPNRIKDREYVQNRPELEAYLNAHPDVREQLMNNPQDFVHAEQQNNTKDSGQSYGSWSDKAPTTTTPGKTPDTTTPTASTPAPTHDPSPKQ